MKVSTLLIIAWLVALCSHPLAAADVVADNFFPPELVEAASEEINLPGNLLEEMEEYLSKVAPRMKELEKRLEEEQQKLGDLARPAKVDVDALLAQLDKVQAAEREMRRLHVEALASVKNRLSAEQQEQLRKWKRAHGADAADFHRKRQQRLERKIERVQEGIQDWKEDGKDPSELAGMMQEFQDLMQRGKVRQAEKVIDLALGKLKKG